MNLREGVQGATEMSDKDSETDVTLKELTDERRDGEMPGACIATHSHTGHL